MKEFETGVFYNEDTFEAMAKLPDASVDMLLVDLPYGTTQNKWDSVIPLEPLWKEYNRICKPSAAMVFTGQQPFTSVLVASNINNFKYEWIWRKSQAVGHLNAKIMPMRAHENILVFGRTKITYNPQMMEKDPKNIRPVGRRAPSDNYGKYNEFAERSIPLNIRYPQSVETFNNPNRGEAGFHPTQKPVSLFEYLIKTYSNEGDTVLDNTAGSGTTAVAAINTNRRWICIEKDETYFNAAIGRLQ